MTAERLLSPDATRRVLGPLRAILAAVAISMLAACASTTRSLSLDKSTGGKQVTRSAAATSAAEGHEAPAPVARDEGKAGDDQREAASAPEENKSGGDDQAAAAADEGKADAGRMDADAAQPTDASEANHASLAGDTDAAGQSAGEMISGKSVSTGGDAEDRASGTGDAGAAAPAEAPAVVGLVDVPGTRVKVEEEVTPQTLGGMLPLTVGIDEEGQFDFDKAVLRPEVKQVLDKLAASLKESEWDRLDVAGYTDRIGTDEYNRQLSERRAWAVARYLMSQGVPLNKMKVVGRGKQGSVLAAGECTKLDRDALIACLQKDRRVEIEASIRKTQARVQ